MEYSIGYKPPPKKKRAVKKECSSCNQLIASSKRVCDCGFVFYEKKEAKPPKKHYEIEFSEVNSGEQLYILGGDFWRSPEGENIGMSECGQFEIVKVTEQGVLAHNKYGYVFFDVISKGYNPKTGITRGKTRFFRCGNNPQHKR